MDPSNILEWVKGAATLGGLGVFIVLVRMFLERQREGDRLILDVRENCTDEMKLARETFSLDLRETRTAFSNQLQNITEKFTALQEAQMKVSIETVSELKGLREDLDRVFDKVAK